MSDNSSKNKNLFSIIVVIILLFFLYFYIKDKIDVSNEFSFLSLGENPLVKIIMIGIGIFVAFHILKAFFKMFSKNV
jgi:uncharacterized integral membrane protein